MRILALALVAAMALGAPAAPASAQTAERVYDDGSVWEVAYIQTKPGMFDDYMAYLAGPWRALQEARKKSGDLLSYKVLSVNATRDGEADVILLTEYKNMAVFDRSAAELDRQTASVFGTVVKSNQAAASRESLRTQKGSVLTREMVFTK